MGEQVTGPRGMRTICPDCHGAGTIRTPRGIIRLATNEASTVVVDEHCKTCDGDGTLPGFMAPV